MSKTHRRNGNWVDKTYRPSKKDRVKSRSGQRNRRRDQKPKQLYSMDSHRFEGFVKACQSKVPHKSRGAAYQAKLDSEAKYGGEFHIYECPICGKWHLTTHQWEFAQEA